MTPSRPGHEVPLETDNKPADAGMERSTILASPAKLDA